MHPGTWQHCFLWCDRLAAFDDFALDTELGLFSLFWASSSSESDKSLPCLVRGKSVHSIAISSKISISSISVISCVNALSWKRCLFIQHRWTIYLFASLSKLLRLRCIAARYWVLAYLNSLLNVSRVMGLVFGTTSFSPMSNKARAFSSPLRARLITHCIRVSSMCVILPEKLE